MSNKIPLFVRGQNGKSCEGCTKCCEGYLTTNIDGQEVYAGHPCKFVEQGVGCKIYKDRPADPCKNFLCFWRASEIMPMEFKPSEVGVIVTNQEWNGIPYLMMVEAGNQIPAEVLSWYVTWAVSNQLNVEWQVGDKIYNMGSAEFQMAMADRARVAEQQRIAGELKKSIVVEN